jgi:hypothetical protein
MSKQSGMSQSNPSLAAAPGAAESDAGRLLARARTMMIISVLTTGLAIAAVAAVVAYRIMGAGGGGSAAGITSGTLFLPPGAKVISTAASGGRIVVTLDIGGTSEVRIFDLKTLQQTGQLRFATEH